MKKDHMNKVLLILAVLILSVFSGCISNKSLGFTIHNKDVKEHLVNVKVNSAGEIILNKTYKMKPGEETSSSVVMENKAVYFSVRVDGGLKVKNYRVGGSVERVWIKVGKNGSVTVLQEVT
jgi:hypothetical protein